MKCEWLKNESNYFVTCKYFRLILQPLQVAGSTESTYKLQNNLTHSLNTHISLYNTSFICAIIFVFIYIYIYIYIY